MEVTKQKIIDLNARLVEANEAYYKKNSPIMSDADFDALERQLKMLVVANPALASYATILKQVGSDLTGGRITHARPMLSIENKYEEQDLIDWYTELPMGTDVCLEPKFDGISVSLTYRDHALIRAATRGTGTEGEDITPQVFAVSAIPKILPPTLPSELEVRGELVMKNSTLQRLNQEAEAMGGKVYTSTRNLTGGTMKLRDTNVIHNREIQMRPWDMLGDDNVLPDSGLARLKLLATAGFPEPLGVVVNNGVAVGMTLKQKLQERETILRKQHSLETDGVVIKVDSHKLRRKLGVGSKYTNYQVCFKPQSASGTTYLREIQWQIGRTGKMSPVAICDPVILAGAKVTNANLNNITWIREKGLKLGAKVEMLRSGDVIPQIVRVIDDGDSDIIPPSKCPECSTSLEESDEGGAGTITHRCPNPNCPAQLIETLTYIGSREILEIDGLGPEMAKKLVNENYARNLGELYQFQTECLKLIAKHGEEGFVAQMRAKGFDVTILKMVKSLENAKTAPWEKWVAAFCIQYTGRTLGKLLATVYQLDSDAIVKVWEKFLDAGTLTDIDGIGPQKGSALKEWACQQVNRHMCQVLYDCGVRPMPVVTTQVIAGAPLKDVAFCITGEFSEARESISRKLVSLGAQAKSGVSSKTNLLIVGEAAGKSKLTKAASLGIKQVGKDWLIQTFEAHGLKLANTDVEVEPA